MLTSAKKYALVEKKLAAQQAAGKTDSASDMGQTGKSRKAAMVEQRVQAQRAAGKSDSAFEPRASAHSTKLLGALKVLDLKVADLKRAYATTDVYVRRGAAAGILDHVAKQRCDMLGQQIARTQRHISALQALQAGNALPAMHDALLLAQADLLVGHGDVAATTARVYEARQAIASHLATLAK